MAEKYLNLSGLQAFYDKLKTTAFVDSALDTTSTKPVQNKVVATNLAAHETDLTTLKNASASWDAKQDAISDLSTIRNSAKSGWSAYSAVTANSATWATDTKTIAGMTDKSTYFDGTSAIYAKSATSATNAANLTNKAIKVNSAGSATNADRWTTMRTIAASGDITWSVSTNGSANVTGAATINSVPSSAISAVPWSAIDEFAAAVDTTTTNKFTTPKAVNDAITAAMNTKASWKGPYATRGDIPSTALDKLSIYLIGPSGAGTDKYEEWILTGTTTAQMLQIGDTSTDLSDYLKTTAFTAWSGVTTSLFSGTSRSAKSAGSAADAGKLAGVAGATVTGNASSGAAASAWIKTNSADYASLTGIKTFKFIDYGGVVGDIDEGPDGTISASTSADTFGIYSNGNNVKITKDGNDLYISAKDTTYNTLNSINTNQYKALTSVSGLTAVKNYGTISAAKGTTSKGSFTPANSASTFTFIAGNNIDFVSGDNSLTISAITPTSPGNGTIKITTGASPATGQFTVNQSTATTITLGSMALKASGDYMATGSMVPYTSAEVTAGITW